MLRTAAVFPFLNGNLCHVVCLAKHLNNRKAVSKLNLGKTILSDSFHRN